MPVPQASSKAIPNELLIHAREQEQWSQNDFLDKFSEKAYELEGNVKVEPRSKRRQDDAIPLALNLDTIKRWEKGESTQPHPTQKRILEALFERTVQQVGFVDKRDTEKIPIWNIE